MNELLTRHSPSSLQLFCASPALFVMERVLGRRQPVGAAAHRGSAVETGVAHGLLNRSADPQECIDIARQKFAELAALCADPRKEKVESGINAMVLRGIAELRPYGEPTATQKLIEWRPEGLKFPIIGYLDFEWSNHGLVVDLKTTDALPSQARTAHARQVSLYCSGTNYGGRLAYVTSAKSAVYEVENIKLHLAALAKIAATVERFLSISDDPMELVGLVCPDVDSFYFAPPPARQAAYETFGV